MSDGWIARALRAAGAALLAGTMLLGAWSLAVTPSAATSGGSAVPAQLPDLIGIIQFYGPDTLTLSTPTWGLCEVTLSADTVVLRAERPAATSDLRPATTVAVWGDAASGCRPLAARVVHIIGRG